MGILLPIIFLPILLLMVAAVFFMVRASIGRGWGPVFRGMRDGRAVCGNCGHEVSLPKIDVCPECGAPYAVAGIATRAAAIRLGPPMFLVVLILFSTAVMFSMVTTPIISFVVQEIVDNDLKDYEVSSTLTPVDEGAGAAVDFEIGVTIDAIVKIRNSTWSEFDPESGTMTLTLTGGDVSTEHELTVDVISGAWDLRAMDGELAPGIEASGTERVDGLVAFFEASGVNPTWADPATGLALDELQSMSGGGGSFTVANGTGMQWQTGSWSLNSTGRSMWVTVAVVILYQAVPIALLLLSILWINHIRRRALGIEVTTDNDDDAEE